MRGVYSIASTGNPKYGGGWNNQQLRKDCGLVPWLLAKNHGFRAVMVGMKCSTEYPYLADMPELELEFLPEDTLVARQEYIGANAAGIDLLILYGAYPHYIPVVETYRQMRPDGKIYLATDMNLNWARRIPHKHPLYTKFLDSCDVIGASNTVVQKYMSKHWRRSVALIRNGFYGEMPSLPKENVILTVGRIGAAEKQNEILLEAFANVAAKMPSWELRLVGAVEESFKSYVEKYFHSHKQLSGRVIFTGQITDRAQLLSEYARAKIFCLTSRFEGTPNVAAEALWAGCYVLTSAIEAAQDITDRESCGKIFPKGDAARLGRLLLNSCRNETKLRSGGEHAKIYARANYDMAAEVAKLNNCCMEVKP